LGVIAHLGKIRHRILSNVNTPNVGSLCKELEMEDYMQGVLNGIEISLAIVRKQITP